jgi:hypothetical protein
LTGSAWQFGRPDESDAGKLLVAAEFPVVSQEPQETAARAPEGDADWRGEARDGSRTPVAASRSERWKERGRRELSRRGYVVFALIFAAFSGISVYKLLTPGHPAVLAVMGLLANILMCSVMIAGFVSRTRRDRDQGRTANE